MNIIKENIDNLNAVVKINIAKADYEPKVDKTLKDYRKKVNIKGFRPGMAPMSLVQKMYGKSVMVDEINKLISESLYGYIKENQISVLGDPIPSESQKTVDFDNDTDYEFSFDLGLTPEFEIKLSKRDKLTSYDIAVNDDLINKQIEAYTSRFGKFEDVSVVESDEMVKGTFTEVDAKNNPIENGIKVEDAFVLLVTMKDEASKAKFKGAKINDEITLNAMTAFPNDTDRAAMLKITKEQAADLKNNFLFKITTIQKHVKAELNQELFNQIYGVDVVKSEEEFRTKIVEEIKKSFSYESDYKLKIDSKDKILGKVEIELPENFLKRWLLATNSEKFTKEQIEKEFPLFAEDLKWQLIKGKIVKENNLSVTEEELLQMAKEVTLAMFKQYGLNQMENEYLENFAKNMLKKEEERHRIFERKLEDKILDVVKEMVKIETKEITLEEFNKMFEN